MTTSAPSDTLSIQDLVITATLGAWSWERCIPQTLYLDIDMPTHAAHAARHDDLAEALDYHAVAAFVRARSVPPVHLIETYAEDLAQAILQQFELPWVTLRLTKPKALDHARAVRLTLTRHRT